MQVVTQLSLLLANRPGSLALVCEVLSKAKITIHALSVSETLDHSLIRVVVDKPHEALKLLESRGTLVLENEVLFLELPNKIGALEKLCQKLVQADVNIEYVYCSCAPNSVNGALILRPSSIAKALKAMNAKPIAKTVSKPKKIRAKAVA
jgi:hypothetical protein